MTKHNITSQTTVVLEIGMKYIYFIHQSNYKVLRHNLNHMAHSASEHHQFYLFIGLILCFENCWLLGPFLKEQDPNKAG